MYQDFYLKFATEEEANTILYTEVVTEWSQPESLDEEPIPVKTEQRPNYRNIDVLGALYKDDAVIDEEGNVVTPPTQVDGWHVNVRAVSDEDNAALEPFRVDPEPMVWRRVWAS
jgi:hypothetical protein